MKRDEQQFLNDLDKKLWTTANKLLPMLDAAVYKHVGLGLIFLKYASDAFQERRAELEAAFRDPEHDYFLGNDGRPLRWGGSTGRRRRALRGRDGAVDGAVERTVC
jgi:type I restriction enzyme M protein